MTAQEDVSTIAPVLFLLIILKVFVSTHLSSAQSLAGMDGQTALISDGATLIITAAPIFVRLPPGTPTEITQPNYAQHDAQTIHGLIARPEPEFVSLCVQVSTTETASTPPFTIHTGIILRNAANALVRSQIPMLIGKLICAHIDAREMTTPQFQLTTTFSLVDASLRFSVPKRQTSTMGRM